MMISSHYNLVSQVNMLHENMSKHQNMCFNPLLLGIKLILFAPSTCNRHLKGKFYKITVDPTQKILTFKNKMFGLEYLQWRTVTWELINKYKYVFPKLSMHSNCHSKAPRSPSGKWKIMGPAIFGRPGRIQGLLYKQPCD